MGTDQDITNINTIGEDALRGGAGDAAVTYAVTSGLEQVARRRIGALAAKRRLAINRERLLDSRINEVHSSLERTRRRRVAPRIVQLPE